MAAWATQPRYQDDVRGVRLLPRVVAENFGDPALRSGVISPGLRPRWRITEYRREEYERERTPREFENLIMPDSRLV